ncbi:MAG: UbiA prenyltransferase family protein [Saprospiraceae bacterium]|nr:UbiA prenyltransferase family protein [Saprospiraceae bacterium]MDW8484061.1 UbiA prenyltransferase family protein [Saprospiraceae bacterium]
MTFRDLLQLLRFEHWVKNLFVLLPAFFAARLIEESIMRSALLAFVAFSAVSSGVYILNDWVDAPQDRNHPDKQNRPMARGAIRKHEAFLLLTAASAGGFALAYFLNPTVLLICALYTGINALYTFWLKHIAIIDISLIGTGFLLRVLAGGAATGVEVSHWLIVMTFLLALILGLAKRRGEYIVAMRGHTFRKALEGYNLPFLDAAMVMCSTVTIVAYLMYCFSPEVTERMGSDRIYYTAFFVIAGILRYLQLTLVFGRTESPTRALLHDAFLQLMLLGWIGAFAWLLYLR